MSRQTKIHGIANYSSKITKRADNILTTERHGPKEIKTSWVNSNDSQTTGKQKKSKETNLEKFKKKKQQKETWKENSRK